MQNIKPESINGRPVGVVAMAIVVVLFITIISGCTDDATRAERHRTRAQQFIAEGRYNEAVLELKNVIKLRPKDYDSIYQLAETYIKMGEFVLAAAAYGDAINTDPENIAAHYKMGHIFLAAGRPMEARKAARLILEKDPNHSGAYQLLAAVQVQEKNLPAAIRTLRKGREVDPQGLMLNLFLAHLLAVDGQDAESETLYKEILSIHPTNSIAYLELSKLYGRQNRWEDAHRLIAGMTPVTDFDFPRLAATARFFEMQRQQELAEQLYQLGADKAPNTATAPLMDLGAYYTRRGELFKALSIMQQALTRKPDDAAILTAIARLQMESGDLSAAENAVDTALTKDAQHAAAVQLKGEILFTRQEYAAAIRQFDLAISLNSDDYRAYFYKALCLSIKGVEIQPDVDLFRAAAGLHDDVETWVAKQIEENLTQALKLKPDLLRAKLMLAEIYLRNGLTDDARKQIESALKQSPEQMETLALLGSLKLMQNDLDGAEAVCRDVLDKHPDRADWHSRLGIVYLREKRPDGAIAAFRKALDLNPQGLTTLKLLTDAYLFKRDFSGAIMAAERHKQHVSQNPRAVAAIDNLQGMIYLAGNKPTDARRRFAAAIAGAPQYIPPHMGLAAIDRRENNLDQAVSQYEAVLSIDARFLPACMALGDIHYLLGDKKKAESYYRQALAVQPDNAQAANNLAYVLSWRDDKLQEALNFAREARIKMPDDPNTRDTYGWILYRMGQYADAAREYELSLRGNPNSALTNYHMGLVDYRQGRFDAARERFRKALKLNPEFEGATEARSLLE